MHTGNETESSRYSESSFQRSDLASIWAELIAAAKTDSKARKFVEYFWADADRLFGKQLPSGSPVATEALVETLRLDLLEVGDRKVVLRTQTQ